MLDGVDRLVPLRLADLEELLRVLRAVRILAAESIQAGQEDLPLPVLRSPRENAPEGPLQAGGVVLRLEGPFGEGAGGLHVGRVVERRERVERRVRARGLHDAGRARLGVEEHRRPDDPPPEDVEAAAVEGLAVVLPVALVAEGGLLPDSRGLVGVHGGAAGFVHEEAARGEGLVAEHPGRHAVARAAREEAVLRVRGREFRAHAGGLAVGLARDEEPEEPLHVPSGVAEARGQPVQELGVDGPLALPPEILRRRGEADAEEHLPEAVDRDARREGVPGRHEPAREAETVPGRIVGEGREG